MGRKTKSRRIRRLKTRLGLPDLDQSKAAVIGSLRSPESHRCQDPALLRARESPKIPHGRNRRT